MTVKIVRDALIANATVKGLVSDRIAPVQELQGQDMPYVILALVSQTPINHLLGFAGLNYSLVTMDAWAGTYKDALLIADACRAALEAVQILCTGTTNDEFVFQADSGAYRHGYTFQVWS